MQGPEIRCDDVLQATFFTKAQVKDLRGRTMFRCFLDVDKIFRKYNYPMTLAICADGIALEERWVKHIKKYKHRYIIELHCNRHLNHREFDRTLLKEELATAKEKIEKEFGVEVKVWYPPWGRKGEHIDGPKVCKELGIEQYNQVGKVDARLWLKRPESYPHVNFHAWNDDQVNTVRVILEKVNESK